MSQEVTLASLGLDAASIRDQTTRNQVAAASTALALRTAPGNGKLARGSTSSIEERAMSLLGANVSVEATAIALGVTPSRISQLMSEQAFSDSVAQLRYENLQKHNIRDDRYDGLEDSLIDKLEKSLPLMLRPTDILRAIAIINGAKRRGQSAPDSAIDSQTIVNLVLPNAVVQKFTKDINNQVIRAGDQNLLTMQTGDLLATVEKQQEQRQLEHAGELINHEVPSG